MKIQEAAPPRARRGYWGDRRRSSPGSGHRGADGAARVAHRGRRGAVVSGRAAPCRYGESGSGPTAAEPESMSTRVELRLSGAMDHLRIVWQTGETLLESVPFQDDPDGTRYNVLLAVQEMVTNILRHA